MDVKRSPIAVNRRKIRPLAKYDDVIMQLHLQGFGIHRIYRQINAEHWMKGETDVISIATIVRRLKELKAQQAEQAELLDKAG